jgi:hypothetical protein
VAASELDLPGGHYFWRCGRVYSDFSAGGRIGERNQVTEKSQPLFDFTDADLKTALGRALKFTVIGGIVLAAVLAVVYGWQTGLLLLAGVVVSATGLWEWQRLVAFINARLDNSQAAGAAAGLGAGRVMTTFILRLMLAGGILYVSLRCLHGSVYALVGGLILGIFFLTVEAVRMIRS